MVHFDYEEYRQNFFGLVNCGILYFLCFKILETDSRDLDVESLKLILLQQPFLSTFR